MGGLVLLVLVLVLVLDKTLSVFFLCVGLCFCFLSSPFLSFPLQACWSRIWD